MVYELIARDLNSFQRQFAVAVEGSDINSPL